MLSNMHFTPFHFQYKVTSALCNSSSARPLCSRNLNHVELPTAIWNCWGTRSIGAWMVPGLPNWPHAAIWSSPLLGLKRTTHPASASIFRNSIILSSLVGLKKDPLCGLNVMRLTLQGIPFTSSISLFASSLLHYRSSKMKIIVFTQNNSIYVIRKTFKSYGPECIIEQE
jgi:hypothetical protein